MELWLIRHPRPEVEPGVCYGRLDLPVAAWEIEAVADRLLPILPPSHRLRTSPAGRCLSLARRLHREPVEDERLLERAFGAWEGMSWDAVGRGPLATWAADPWGFAPPGGESTRALAARVAVALEEEVAAGGVAIWVTHQGVIRTVVGMLLELKDEVWMKAELPFGGVRRMVAKEGKWQEKEEIAAGD